LSYTAEYDNVCIMLKEMTKKSIDQDISWKRR